jgi:hypothetical protein
MSERKPIDDIFARALRDAEAEPPPRGLDGILRERAKRRAGWLRRWGWLPLLLLLFSGGTGYLLSGHRTLAVGNGSQAGTNTAAQGQAGTGLLALNEEVHPEPVNPNDDAHWPNSDVKHEAPETAPVSAQLSPSIPADRPIPPTAAARNVHGTTISTKHGAPGSLAQNVDPAPVWPSVEHPAEAIASIGAGFIGTTEREGTVFLNEQERPEAGRAFPLRIRWSAFGDSMSIPGLRNAGSTTFKRPRRSFWVAATAGGFSESRTWTGGDEDWRKALQSSERMHSTSALGLLAGMDLRGGWSVATGLEYHTGRYNFQHAENLLTRRDSIVNYIITFNSLVLSTITDTITSYTEETRTTAVLNRYAMLRIPVELGWHTSWHRFRVGARGGLALELTTLRSGATFIRSDQGLQSVDIQSAAAKHCMSVLGGSIGTDVGFAITEQWSVWASPVYETGLLSLLPKDNTPFALAHRTGLRLRLAYTIRP